MKSSLSFEELVADIKASVAAEINIKAPIPPKSPPSFSINQPSSSPEVDSVNDDMAELFNDIFCSSVQQKSSSNETENNDIRKNTTNTSNINTIKQQQQQQKQQNKTGKLNRINKKIPNGDVYGDYNNNDNNNNGNDKNDNQMLKFENDIDSLQNFFNLQYPLFNFTGSFNEANSDEYFNNLEYILTSRFGRRKQNTRKYQQIKQEDDAKEQNEERSGREKGRKKEAAEEFEGLLKDSGLTRRNLLVEDHANNYRIENQCKRKVGSKRND